MKENKYLKSLLWILLLCFYIFLNVVFSSAIVSFHIKNDCVLNIVYIMAELLITIIFVYLYRKDFKGKFKELKNDKKKKKIKDSVKCWIYGLLGMMFFNIILSYIIGDIAENESLNREVIANTSIYAIISMAILTPICEETLFRLSVSKMFDNKFIYIIFSGIIFGFAHVIGTEGLQTLYILPYTVLGISFAYIYNKYKNIYCSIFMHMLHNIFCLILIFCL